MIFFTLVLIAQCDIFLEPISILSLRGQLVLVGFEGMRFSLDSSDHSPTPSSKSLEISSRNLYIGIRGRIAYYLFVFF